MDTVTGPVILAAAFWVTFICWVGVSWWEGRGRQTKQTTPEGRKNDLLCFFGTGAAGFVALLSKGLFPDVALYHGPALFWLGIAFIWAGLLLRHWAVATLGRYHVMTIHTELKQPVITTGPYRYIRHPSYLGALGAVVGIALAINSLPGGVILVAVTAGTLIQRICIEDRYLLEHLGTAYSEYTKHTRRLLPFVW
ncbi:MAG TPA: isoprenylcysteine carboxylmethyltransferase family protein [Candidatus Saccharimonadales bacterium]|jgi:protein-S-isoprenylcysteine O-methyltransferase Ste14